MEKQDVHHFLLQESYFLFMNFRVSRKELDFWELNRANGNKEAHRTFVFLFIIVFDNFASERESSFKLTIKLGIINKTARNQSFVEKLTQLYRLLNNLCNPEEKNVQYLQYLI